MHFIKNLVFRLFHHFMMHFNVCCYHFDPVYEIPPEIAAADHLSEYRQKRSDEAEATLHRYFYLPAVMLSYLALDTLRVLYQSNFAYRTNLLPDMYTHRMYPDPIVKHGDMLILCASCSCMGLPLLFLSKEWLSDKYCMYMIHDEQGDLKNCRLIVNGKAWEKESGVRICRLHLQNHHRMAWFAVSSSMCATSYFFWNFAQKPFSDVKYYFDMYIFLPMFGWYLVAFVVLMPFQFIMLTKYTLIKQDHLWKRLKALNERLRSQKTGSRYSPYAFYYEFLVINRHLAYQCAEIGAYNQFWASVLSFVFIAKIGDFVYLAYAFVFTSFTIAQRAFFGFFSLEIGIITFAIIGRCSLVDYNNDRFYLANMKASVAFQMHYGQRLSLRTLANIDKIATNRNFSKACFRLFNGYRLDSTAFNMVLYIISTFFLMICRQNRRSLQRLPTDTHFDI